MARLAEVALGVGLCLGALVGAARLLAPMAAAPSGAGTIAQAVSLADLVVSGQAMVASPTGSTLGPQAFVDVRPAVIQAQDRPLRDAGRRPRRWLYTHPPSEVAFDLTVPPDAVFQASLALDPMVWEASLGDGTRFIATLTLASGQSVSLLDAAVNPRARGEQRRWLDLALDLRPWAGQRARLSLRTEGRLDPANDWAGWGEPVIAQVDALTADRLLQSTAALRAVALGG